MILLLDNYDSFTYNLYQLIADLGCVVKVVRNDKITINEIKSLNPEAIVLSPGPGRPENAGILVDVVKAFSGSVPILGVCLGHQAIVAAFGGEIVHATDIVHGKKATIFHARDTFHEKVTLPFQAARYHSLMAKKSQLPEALRVNAETPEGEIMGVCHQEHPTYGVQYHPESILTPEGRQLIKNFIRIAEYFNA